MLPKQDEVSEKAKEIGARVYKRVIRRMLEDRDRRIAKLEVENADLAGQIIGRTGERDALTKGLLAILDWLLGPEEESEKNT